MRLGSAGVTDVRAEHGTETFAVFPLNVVLFPDGLLPLRIFEPRYQRMVSECLREDRPFVVAAIVEGREAGAPALTAQTGSLARIIDWEQLEDGLLGLLCQGEQRVSLGRLEAEPDGLLRGQAARLPDEQPAAFPGEYAWMASLLDEILQQTGEPFDRLLGVSPSAAHVAHRLIELLPLPIALKQALFDLPDPLTRLQRLSALIAVDSDGD